MLIAVSLFMKSYQVSFFDESQRLAALSRLNDPLVEMRGPILTLESRLPYPEMPAGVSVLLLWEWILKRTENGV